jgi:hypothetical protein
MAEGYHRERRRRAVPTPGQIGLPMTSLASGSLRARPLALAGSIRAG